MFSGFRMALLACLTSVAVVLSICAVLAANGLGFAAAPQVVELLHASSVFLFGSHKVSRLITQRTSKTRLHVRGCAWLAATGLLVWVVGLLLGQSSTALLGFGMLLISHCLDCSCELWMELRRYLRRLVRRE